jgi:hypothetical protein
VLRNTSRPRGRQIPTGPSRDDERTRQRPHGLLPITCQGRGGYTFLARLTGMERSQPFRRPRVAAVFRRPTTGRDQRCRTHCRGGIPRLDQAERRCGPRAGSTLPTVHLRGERSASLQAFFGVLALQLRPKRAIAGLPLPVRSKQISGTLKFPASTTLATRRRSFGNSSRIGRRFFKIFSKIQ